MKTTPVMRRITIPSLFTKKISEDTPWVKRMFAVHKPGSAHRMFGVTKGVKLPRTFLQVIVNTPLMEIAHNPTQIGFKSIKVTHLVKSRANGLLNAIRLHTKAKERK